jgi:hypothetical protein
MPTEGSALERPKPDPNVVVPAAVKRASERADELAKQAKELKAANPDGDKNVQAVTQSPQGNNPAVVVTDFDPNNPQPPGENQLSIVGQQPQPQPPQAPQPQNPADWEHQFKSLQGRYSRTDEENRRMSQQIADMQRLLATVSTPQPAPPSAAPEGSGVRFGAQRRITPKEEEEFGKEFIDVVGRRAMEIQEATLSPVLSQLQQELMGIKQQLGGVRQTQQVDAQERIWNHLDKEVPDWQAINGHPDFVRWLQIPDALSGLRRYDMLDEAFKTQQVGRVINFFKHFLNDMGYAQRPNAQQSAQSGNGVGQPTPQLDLAAFAAPGRAKAGQPVEQANKPMYSVHEIKQFYTDRTFGKYKGREAEAQAIENDFFAAQREGRIRVT